jgi:hypothetical protein
MSNIEIIEHKVGMDTGIFLSTSFPGNVYVIPKSLFFRKQFIFFLVMS